MSTFIIKDNNLVRSRPVYRGGTTIGIEEQLVITKEEFLACYNEWVKGEEE